MRQHVAKLIPPILVGGCSFIYDPGKIDKPRSDATIVDMGEVPVDVEIRADASPMDLDLTELHPTTILEGTGTGVGARPGIVVLRGRNFIKDASAMLAVTVTPTTTGTLNLTSFEVSGNGDYIVLELAAPVTNCAEGTSVPVTVQVEQNDGVGGRVNRMLGGLSVTCLDELTTAPSASGALDAVYSKIEITSAGITFTPAASSRATLRSASFIHVGGSIVADASGIEPGPGGGRGGELIEATGGGPRPGGRGTGITAGAGGGGGGFVIGGTNGGNGTAGTGGAGGGTTGDVWISSYVTNASSGGGAGSPVTGDTPGTGGGGGGTVELVAPGAITVAGTISANGAAGGSASLAGDGGAGTGGVVLVRTGATLSSLAAISVAKGDKTGNGGDSSVGRARVDAAAGSVPSNAQRGPMFVSVPTKTTLQMHGFNLTGTANDSTSTLRVFDKAGAVVANMTYTPIFGASGTASVTTVLKAGYNKVCVWVSGGDPTRDESVNCVEVGYLPP